MRSVTLREVLRQTRELVSDPEDRLYGDLDSAMADAIKRLLESIAPSGAEKRSGVKICERSDARKDYRNGYRSRKVQTSFTTITIRIPRLREQGYVPSFLEPNQRATRHVEDWVAKALLVSLPGCGVGQRHRRSKDKPGLHTHSSRDNRGWREGSAGVREGSEGERILLERVPGAAEGERSRSESAEASDLG